MKQRLNPDFSVGCDGMKLFCNNVRPSVAVAIGKVHFVLLGPKEMVVTRAVASDVRTLDSFTSHTIYSSIVGCHYILHVHNIIFEYHSGNRKVDGSM